MLDVTAELAAVESVDGTVGVAARGAEGVRHSCSSAFMTCLTGESMRVATESPLTLEAS